jgi:hypothetical protein
MNGLVDAEAEMVKVLAASSCLSNTTAVQSLTLAGLKTLSWHEWAGEC